MKQLHYCLGLPRACSTVLMNILNENPRIFTTGTCALTNFMNACQYSAGAGEFAALKKEVMIKAYVNFLRQGINGWFETMTDKPVVFSKGRNWAEWLPHTFAIDPNSKYLVVIRDLRDIICSFESLIWKQPNVIKGEREKQFYTLSFEERIHQYCTEMCGILGRPLHFLPHVVEVSKKHPDSFFFLRQEDFTEDPKKMLRQIYEWLGEDYFEHDLDNIPEPDYYEHDGIYNQGLVTHQIRSKLEKLEPRWPKMMNELQSQQVLQMNQWYYDEFYND